jgi:excisionase family DNA binding protein
VRSQPASALNGLRDTACQKASYDEYVEFPKLLVTIEEAAHILSISRSKVYGLLNTGQLLSIHIGRARRIRLRDIESFVAESQIDS